MKVIKKIPDAFGALDRHLKQFGLRMTFKRLINLCIILIEMVFKRKRLLSKPAIAKIEASSICNLRCFGCRSGAQSALVEYPPGKLSISDFEVMVEKMGDYLFEIVLYLWGEPLTNKDLPALIKVAHNKNIAVGISTNLHFLTEEMGEKLLDAQLDKMIFCIDGWSQETYGQVRIKGNFETVKNNIQRFAQQKKAANSRKPHLEWQYVVTEDNFPELESAKRAAQKWGVDKFTEIADWGKRLKKKDHFKGLAKTKKQMYEKINRCYWLWSSIAVQYDGNVFPCCHVANKPHQQRIYGNILKDSLGDVWNSELYQKARLLLQSSRSISEGEFICKECFSPPVFTYKKETDTKILQGNQK